MIQVSSMCFVENNSLGIAENIVILHCRLVATTSNERGRLGAGV